MRARLKARVPAPTIADRRLPRVNQRLLRGIDPDEDHLDEALAHLMDFPEVWVVRPRIRAALTQWFDYTVRERFRSRLAAQAFVLRRTTCNYATDSSHVTVCWTTVNERLNLGRRATVDAVARDTTPVRLAALMPSLLRRAHDLSSEILAAIQEVCAATRTPVSRLVRTAIQDLLCAERVLELRSTRAFVVATQQSPQSRAVALVARREGIPTVYLPHAPIAWNRRYTDLPFDYGALRGQREVDFYVGLGADPQRLAAVGNLSLDRRFDSSAPRDGPIIVAPSPWGKDLVEAFMTAVAAAIDGEYLVLPHPRSDTAHLEELVPPRARMVTDRRTSDQLVDGARAIVQHSSGVALEAMMLGVPVIDLSVGGREPILPLLAEPHVYFASGHRELRACLARLERGESAAQVAERRGWAREWCSSTSDSAEAGLTRLLESQIRSQGPILDGWSLGS